MRRTIKTDPERTERNTNSLVGVSNPTIAGIEYCHSINFRKGESVKNKIIKYKLFNSSEEFELFQNENEVAIINIVPIANTANNNIKDNCDEMNLSIGFGVFVTYLDSTEVVK